MYRTIMVAGLVSLCVAGCGDDGAAGLDAANPSADAPAASTDASTVNRVDVTFTVDGDQTLTGYLTTSATSPAQSPGVLLIHQYLQTDEQWSTFATELAGSGYRVLAFNLRGHGDSAAYPGPMQDILTDPVTAPADVDAALSYLVGTGAADPTRIAIIGTSIGANLTVAAAVRGLAKTYVSISARKSAVEIFAGSPATTMASVFYLASELDGGGVQAGDAQLMHDSTTTPRDLKIYASVADHGVAIVQNQSDATTLISDWLAQQL